MNRRELLQGAAAAGLAALLPATVAAADASGELMRLHLAYEVEGEELAERRRLCRRMARVEVIEWNLAEEGLDLGALRPGDHLWMLVEDYRRGCQTAKLLRRSLPDVVVSVYDASPL